MTENQDDFGPMFDKSMETSQAMLDKYLAAAKPGAVFGEPIRSGDYLVITASEVTAGGGFGTGFGVGGPGGGQQETPVQAGGAGSAGGIGAGGGGGGGSMGRPVATITIGPDGVQIKPILDFTKLGIALFTAWGAMIVAAMRMRRTGE